MITKFVLPQPTVFDQDRLDQVIADAPPEKLNALLEAVRLAEPPRYIDQDPRWKLEGNEWVLDITDGAS